MKGEQGMKGNPFIDGNLTSQKIQTMKERLQIFESKLSNYCK